jgi:hypothetical protein
MPPALLATDRSGLACWCGSCQCHAHPRQRIQLGRAMRTDKDGTYNKTDVLVAMVLAVLAAAWIVAYIVAFIQSGPA